MDSESVWVVTRGEYSDYHIEAVFSTAEKAQIFCAAFTRGAYDDAPEVTEWGLGTWQPESVQYTFVFTPEGLLVEEYALPDSENSNIQNYQSRSGRNISITIGGGPRDRAVKSATECRMRLLAQFDTARDLVNRAGEDESIDSLVFDIARILSGVTSLEEIAVPTSNWHTRLKNILGVPRAKNSPASLSSLGAST